MPSALDPMPPHQQRGFHALYLDHLRRRDGVPDLSTRRFDVRERLFAGIDRAPCLWSGTPPVDQARFDHNHTLRTPESDLDELTLWALATAKTNRAERFGVELSLDHQRPPSDLAGDPHTYIQIEEFYHTRILRDVLATIGLTMDVALPNPRTRLLVRAMVHLPAFIADVAVLCGEIVGVTTFTLLLDKSRALLASQPQALERVEALFAQILVDEVGHVHYLRSRLSPTQMAWARRLLPFVVDSVLSDIPELARLFGREAILAHASAADVDGAASPYPDRLVLTVS